jgi:hypothetical protein
MLGKGLARVHTRYSFTAQFVGGAALLQRRAAEIEGLAAPAPLAQVEHRALVVSIMMQAGAALGTELEEILRHGPGHHLGSNGIDHAALAILSPVADLISRSQGVLDKYEIVLALLHKSPLKKGEAIYQNASLLVDLRNELEHYESKWEGKTKRATLLKTLQQKKFAPPPFVNPAANFFPHKALSAACARWAVETSAAFIDHAYDLLGVPSMLDAHRRSDAESASIIPARRTPRPSRG